MDKKCVSKVKSHRKYVNPVFHLQTESEDDKLLTKDMIKNTRRTGKLNLSARHLSTVPDKLFNIYETTEHVEVDYNRPVKDEDAWWNIKPLTHLDLSSNVLTVIPKQIGMFQEMRVLSLHDNNLTELPKDIGNLTKLSKLTLNRNKINNLPEELFKLTDLTVLNLNSNCLENVSQSISDLVMLVKLDLSDNKITELPPGMGFLIRLIELNVSKNQLKEIPPDIVNLRDLVKLDISHNNVKKLPPMGELRKLQILYAQHNDIDEIPDFTGCEKIEEIYFGNNFIKEIPLEFCECMFHLKILELRDNQIEVVPKEIIKLCRVTKLDFTNNDIKELPNIIGYLPHLRMLKLDGNKPKNIRVSVLRGGCIRSVEVLRRQATKEELEEYNLASVDDFAPEKPKFPNRYQMKNGNILNLAFKVIAHVPDECFLEAKEAQVSSVDLCKNMFTSVPEGLLNLTEYLTELNMSSNQLRNIPEFLGQFTKLKYLNVSKNQITDLPECLNSMTYLRELVLSYNKFSKVPDCVYGMVGLEILIINDNDIKEIDVVGLQKLRRLATLDLSNNSIGQVPPELGNVTQLRSLELKGNQFRQPRYAILEKGTEAVLSYLRSKIPVP